jgi:hypothetical protein
MKHELELKVQAWLDGETPDRDGGRLADWIAHDAEAGAVASELRTVTQAMTGNELTVALPETREFFWSKIERQIEREASAPRSASVSWLADWRRFALPVTGAAALICVLTFAIRQANQPTFDEISATDEGMDAVTFHDQSAEMTVVWLQDNSQPSEAAQKTANVPAPDEANSETDME